MEKKQARKRDKLLHRRGKKGTPVSKSDNSACIDDENDSILLTERSLTDMLASDTPQPILSSSPHSANNSSQNGNILQESRLLALSLQLEGQTNEVERLKNVVDLLESEITAMKKVDKSQKSEIKKLKNENDNFRRELSRFRGMRKFTEATNKSVSACDKSCDTSDIVRECVSDELSITKAKLSSLREQIVTIASSMLTALDDEDDSFQPVRRGRHNVSPPKHGQNDIITQHGTYSAVAAMQPPTRPEVHGSTSLPSRGTACQTSHNRTVPATTQRPNATATSAPASGTSQPVGQRIPVVTLGLRRSSETSDTAAPKAGERESIMIGSSLVKDIGGRLNKLGVSASCYVYRGATIPFLRSRVRSIINPNKTPKNVVLMCGGNDCEHYPVHDVIKQYEKLIADIRAQCGPNVPVLLCKVPPRGGSVNTSRAIDQLNAYLDRLVRMHACVHTVDVSPKSPSYFLNDHIHFNGKGKTLIAKKLAGNLRNFHRANPTTYKIWVLLIEKLLNQW